MYWCILCIRTCYHVGDMSRGESTFRQDGNLVVSAWRDRKLVYIMSTNCQPEGDATVRRKNRDGTTQTVACPPSVVAYNQFMGGVDKSDQIRGYHRVRCKSRKFYRYIFWFLFDSCSVNAFILFKNFQPLTNATIGQTTAVKNFRVRLAEGLIAEYNSRQRYSLPAPIRAIATDCTPPATKRQRVGSSVAGGHFPIRRSRSKCTYCWNIKGHRRYDTYMWCRQCGKACVVARDPPADGPSCFERYHTESCLTAPHTRVLPLTASAKLYRHYTAC